ncbi:MAG: hypothetical protein Q9181_002543 [Wetmoreana brouardii]
MSFEPGTVTQLSDAANRLPSAASAEYRLFDHHWVDWHRANDEVFDFQLDDLSNVEARDFDLSAPVISDRLSNLPDASIFGVLPSNIEDILDGRCRRNIGCSVTRSTMMWELPRQVGDQVAADQELAVILNTRTNRMKDKILMHYPQSDIALSSSRDAADMGGDENDAPQASGSNTYQVIPNPGMPTQAFYPEMDQDGFVKPLIDMTSEERAEMQRPENNDKRLAFWSFGGVVEVIPARVTGQIPNQYVASRRSSLETRRIPSQQS